MNWLLDRLRGHGIKTRLLNPYDAVWDAWLGIKTFGYHPASGSEGESDWRVHYQPTPFSDIFRLLRMVGLTKDDVFVDVGAGLGRAVFAASWLGAGRSVGIEIVPDLCRRAEENRKHSRLADRNIEFICAHAVDYQHSDTSVLFMFHPFGGDIMQQVLRGTETPARPRGGCASSDEPGIRPCARTDGVARADCAGAAAAALAVVGLCRGALAVEAVEVSDGACGAQRRQSSSVIRGTREAREPGIQTLALSLFTDSGLANFARPRE